MHTAANASLIAGLGYTGILVSFVARHNPWAIPPVAVLFGGFGAAGFDHHDGHVAVVELAPGHDQLEGGRIALFVGGFGAAGSLLQRRLDLPDASVLVLQGFAFVLILAAEAGRGRLLAARAPKPLPPAVPPADPNAPPPVIHASAVAN